MSPDMKAMVESWHERFGCPKCGKPMKEQGVSLAYTCQCFTEVFRDAPSNRKLLGLPEGDLTWRATNL